MNLKKTLSTNASGFLRLPSVLSLTGIGKTKLYGLIQAGQFPPPVKIGSRISVWPESDVSDWIEAQICASRNGGAA